MLLDRRAPRLRRVVMRVSVGLLLAGLLRAATWQVIAWQTREAVVVGADARPFQCASGSTVQAGGGDDLADPGDRFTSALVLTRGVDCDMRFVVANESGLPVRVRAVQLSLLGPDSDLPVQATTLDGGFFLVAARPAGDRVDARFTVPGAGMDISAGQQVVLFARLQWKGTGCLQTGATTTVGDSPAVTISALGADGVRTAALASWAYRGKDRTSCPNGR